MPDTPIDLVFPGDPFVFPVIEQEPARSRYTGKMLRQFQVGVRARDAELNEQLEATLSGTGQEGAVLSDRAGGRWKVTSRSYSYQQGQAAPDIHNVDIVEQEDLHLERVEFDGLSLVPDRWSLEPYGEANSLTFLATMDAGTHQRFERVLEHRQADPDAETYFPVKMVGITEEPVSMRFGECLWQRLDGGGARHRIVLVSERGDDPDQGGPGLFEPERSRLMQQAVIVNMKLDALIEELHRAGVLDDEAITRITQEVTRLPFAPMREFHRVGDIDLFFR
jgi:hypothetical protein